MVEFVEYEEARARSGWRMSVVSGGVPSPWGEAAKGILHVKKIPWVAVRMPPGDNPVTEWTGQQSAPVVMYDDEPPRPRWEQILLLAERVAPTPALLPADPEARALCLGLSHEICGEMGLGWCRRLVGIDRGLASDGAEGFAAPIARYLGGKYGWREGCGEEAQRRVVEILGMLSRRLHGQREAGSPYYLDHGLSALDVYSATFLVMFAPLPPEHCPMPEPLRAMFENLDDETRAALDPILVEHRDRIYAEQLELPLQL
jgi:glutathione S-transferase